MAKSLSSILSQVERLQKEAASIQLEVIDRLKKDIAKYGLTAEHLFGQPAASRQGTPGKRAKQATSKEKTAKYADGAGNTWGGMGPRPAWLRQALEAGKSMEEFLLNASGTTPRASKRAVKAKTAAVPKRQAPAKKSVAAKMPAGRKHRAKASAEARAA